MENNNNNKEKNGDLFELTLNDFAVEKKKKKIKLRIEDDKDKEKGNINTNGNNNSTNNPGSTKNNSKQVYLFYRTPSNKENKKIDFSCTGFKPAQ